MKNLRVLLAFAVLILFSAVACKKEAQRARLTVYLTDAPANYDAVNIQLREVQVKATTENSENGWQTLPLAVSPVTYDLLEFKNGMEALLSTVELPAGRISQIRLILGNNNSIVVNGVTESLPIDIPSGQQTGLKLNIQADLEAGVEYKLWIDFDVARSIVLNGNGDYILKPVIRTFTESTSGAIKGVVLPAAANAIVSVSNGIVMFGAIPDAITGEFLIRGVPPGVWNITLDGNNGYIDQVINNVPVDLGEVTDVGSRTLVQ